MADPIHDILSCIQAHFRVRLGEESYIKECTALRQSQWEGDNNLLRRVWECVILNCNDRNNYGGMGGEILHTKVNTHTIPYPFLFLVRIISTENMYISFWHSVELRDWRYAHMSSWGNMTDFSSFLGSTERIKPSLFSFYECTQTHTSSKSLARMTGNGQKQIMVIDRCLEMDLCMCVTEQRMGD